MPFANYLPSFVDKIPTDVSTSFIADIEKSVGTLRKQQKCTFSQLTEHFKPLLKAYMFHLLSSQECLTKLKVKLWFFCFHILKKREEMSISCLQWEEWETLECEGTGFLVPN